MVSWIRKQNGVEWYDERHACRRAHKTPKQMKALAASGKVRTMIDSPTGATWYAGPDMEEVGAQHQKRSTAAAKAAATRSKSPKYLEAQWAKQSRENQKLPRYAGGVSVHHEKVLLTEIARDNEARRKKGE